MITGFRKTASLAILVGILSSCGTTRNTTNTNVLSKNNHQPPGSNQTVFVKPEPGKRRPPVDNKEQTQTNAGEGKPLINIELPPVPEVNRAELVAGSPQYYAWLTDSAQRAWAVRVYKSNMDSFFNQLAIIPSRQSNPAVNSDRYYATPNFNIRKPSFVIIHHTNQLSKEQTLFTFSITPTEHSPVSAHYVIGKDGTVFQLLNDYLRAWHAGAGKWGNIEDMNSCSLGIELDNNGTDEPFTDAQISALIKLLGILKKKYSIPTANFIGHADYAAGRKDDPSKFFPWKRLADAGFGYWYDADNLKTPPEDFNPLMALRIIGYDIREPEKAISAFKLHFIQNDQTPVLTDYDKKVLYNVYTKY